MNAVRKTQEVSIRFTLTLENSLSATERVTGDRFDYTPGEEEVMPALEEASPLDSRPGRQGGEPRF